MLIYVGMFVNNSLVFSYLYLVPTLLLNTKKVLPIFFSFGGVRLLFVKFSCISGVCGFRGVTFD